jgi:neutral ceramidase
MKHKVGTAKVNITPDFEVELSGFAARVQPCLGVHDPIFLRALYLEEERERLLWIHADLLAFSNELVAEMKARFEQRFGLESHQIAFSATHTHCAPTVLPLLCAGEDEAGYIKWLCPRIDEVAARAMQQTEWVSPFFGESRCSLAVDRRGKASAHLDPRAMVIGWKRNDGGWVSVLANYPIHHVAFNWEQREISADMAGVAAACLEEGLPGSPVVLLTNGAAANLNPPFLTAQPAQVRDWGEEIAGALRSALAGSQRIEGGLQCAEEAVAIPLHTWEASSLAVDRFLDSIQNRSGALAAIAEGPDYDFLARQLARAGEKWQAKMSQSLLRGVAPDSLTLNLQALRLGEVEFILFGGEIFSVMADELRIETGEKIFVVGFANGYSGYICPEVVYQEGGYEPDMAFIFGGIPRPRPGGHEAARAAAARLLRSLRRRSAPVGQRISRG